MKQEKQRILSEQLHNAALAVMEMERQINFLQARLKQANALLQAVSQELEQSGVEEFAEGEKSLLLHRVNEYLMS